MSEKLVLVDGHSILNRAFYGVPDLSNAQGLHTNAIYGFLNILFKILEEEKPDYLAVAFDVHAPTFRHEIYKDYKGTRKSMPDELREQVPVMKEVLRAMHIVIVEQAGLEADDILGTLAKKAEKEGMEVSLVSGDRDLLQIASEHIKIRIPKTKQGRTEIEDYFAEDVKALYQVTPLQFIELKALMGDASDNIPGVPKVGEKTAIALMTEYGSLDNLYAHVDEVGKKAVRESLIANKDLAYLSRLLATIKTDCDLNLDYQSAKAEGFFTREAYQIFKRLEFKNILTRFEQEQKADDNDVTAGFAVLESAQEMEKKLRAVSAEKKRVDEPAGNIYQEWTGFYLAVDGGRLLGIALSLSEKDTCCYFLTEEDRKDLEGRKDLEDRKNLEGRDAGNLEDALISFSRNVSIASIDIKKQYLSQESTDRYFDNLIGAYLLNPLKSDYDVESIASEFLDLKIPGYGELFGKLSLTDAFREKPEEMAGYLCYNAYVSGKAASVIRKRLQETGME